MLKRARRLVQALIAAPGGTPSAAGSLPALADEIRAARRDPDEWIDARRKSAASYVDSGPSTLATLCARQPSCVATTIAAAERIIGHQFDLLGSGPFVPRDPDRPPKEEYTPIDWYLDPVARVRFPRGIPRERWNLEAMRPGAADIKLPWELARCHHWVVLGQAHRLTGETRFAREIANQFDDFQEANPIGIGINWTCTMDVALRAANWVAALDLVRECAALPAQFWRRAYAALFDHGTFIEGNLENTYEVTSNHFLSDVVGLNFVGAVFRDLPRGARWRAFCRASLEQEIATQVLPDGADFESSIPYHRLVTELFLAGARLADRDGEPLSVQYRARVKDMVAYLVAVIRPDGLMPQVGDADDGRLHVLTGYGTVTPQDPRHVFGPAAVMFDRPSWLDLASGAGRWEAVWWGLDPDGVCPEADAAAGDPRNRLFPDAGVAVMRHGDTYLLVTNGIVGTGGFGNHKHNDQLSFEYHHDGVPLIVDPGSYVYTRDPDARNRFRSTRSHNTLMIDGVEQHDLRPQWLFRLFEAAHGEHLIFEERDGAVEYAGRHHGYERLSEGVTHDRALRLDKASGALEIVDRLTGRGMHDLRWHFHLAPGVGARPDGGTIRLTAAGRGWRLSFPPSLHASIDPAAYSPSYGVKVPIVNVVLTTRTAIAGQRVWQIDVKPES